jgi:hypothetical protein
MGVLSHCGRVDGVGVEIGEVDGELVVAGGADRLTGVCGVGRGALAGGVQYDDGVGVVAGIDQVANDLVGYVAPSEVFVVRMLMAPARRLEYAARLLAIGTSGSRSVVDRWSDFRRPRRTGVCEIGSSTRLSVGAIQVRLIGAGGTVGDVFPR